MVVYLFWFCLNRKEKNEVERKNNYFSWYIDIFCLLLCEWEIVGLSNS